VHDEGDALIDLSGWTARKKIKSVTDQLLVSLKTTPTANGDVLTLGEAGWYGPNLRQHSYHGPTRLRRKASTTSSWSIR